MASTYEIARYCGQCRQLHTQRHPDMFRVPSAFIEIHGRHAGFKRIRCAVPTSDEDFLNQLALVRARFNKDCAAAVRDAFE
jgi:hypothetical protein